MSLINDVLRNLEANRPDDLAGQRLQREIRSLPPAAPSYRRHRARLLGLVLLLLLTAAVWQGRDRLDPWPLADLPPPSDAAAAPPPAASAAPAENLILAKELLFLPPPAAPQPALQPAPAPSPAPSPPPRVAVANPPPPDMAAPRRSVAAAGESPPLSEPAAEPAVVAPVPARIDKSPLPVTPRDRADADVRRAEAAFASGRGEDGRAALRAALRQDPQYLQVRQALLRHLLAERRIDEAITVLEEGLALQPAQTGWAMSLARLQLEQDNVAAADHTLARSQAFAENSADYAGFQGLLKSRLGAQRQAAAHYQRAARLAPDDGRWWLGLGLALEADGRLPESREALRRALALPNLPSELATVAEQHLR